MADQRISLNDDVVARLPFAQGGQYKARDTELKGFYVLVGARRKTFCVYGEYWNEGARKSTRQTIGSAADLTTRAARKLARDHLVRIAAGEFAAEAAADAPPPAAGVTLRQAWDRYRDSHLRRKERSEATIRGFRDHVERYMADWLDEPLMTLGEHPRLVADRHDKITRENGPFAANGCMRTLRAIYNHARRSARQLPPDNPTTAVDWNVERRRDSAMGVDDLPRWFEQARALRHQIRREFHLFTLLSGSRPGALMQARVADLDLAGRILHIPRPKGGAKRAFDIPLSRAMVHCLIRAMRVSRELYPEQAETWIFAAASEEGHLVEHKEDRAKLFKWGNDLRQTYRTVGQAAGLSDIDMHLLMNHSLPGVNAGYITRAKLLDDHLREAQERLSTFIIDAAAKAARKQEDGILRWPQLPARQVGDEIRDPRAPDVRLGKPQKRRQSPDRIAA